MMLTLEGRQSVHETANLHFDLSHLAPDQPFTLHVGSSRYDLAPNLSTYEANISASLTIAPDDGRAQPADKLATQEPREGIRSPGDGKPQPGTLGQSTHDATSTSPLKLRCHVVEQRS